MPMLRAQNEQQIGAIYRLFPGDRHLRLWVIGGLGLSVNDDAFTRLMQQPEFAGYATYRQSRTALVPWWTVDAVNLPG